MKPEIDGPAALKGKKLASPQLGNTQDVALRYWLSSQGLKTDTTGGGDVSVVPQENSQTLQTFKQGTIAGAWVMRNDSANSNRTSDVSSPHDESAASYR